MRRAASLQRLARRLEETGRLNEGPSLGHLLGRWGWGRRRAARRSAGANEPTRRAILSRNCEAVAEFPNGTGYPRAGAYRSQPKRGLPAGAGRM